MRPEMDYRLYLYTNRRIMTTETIEEAVELAIQGGVTIVQLREKDCTTKKFYELAVMVKQVTDAYEVPLIINDRPDIALAIGADGVHLGQDDLPIRVARNVMGADKVVGATVHSVEEAVHAWKSGADYLGAGELFGTFPILDSNGMTMDVFREICDSVPIPVVAVGGIKPDNVGVLNDTKAAGVAVTSAILGKEDITEAAEEIVKRWNPIV